MIKNIAVAVLLFSFLSACSNQPQKTTNSSTTKIQEQQSTESSEQWQILAGEQKCFPVDDQVFDHPIDHLPLPLAPNDNIWPRIQAGLALPEVDHPLVKKYINQYSKSPKYLARIQQRASRYLYFIVNHLHEQDVPYDIALLPIVESAYEPFSYSHGQAAGLWQFIPMTAGRFKLNKSWWLDERRDPTQASVAAVKYLKYLNGFFNGDWLIAIAAYNAGEGTLQKAVRKNRKQGKPTDFWHLKLREEPTNYVPKLIALSMIFRDPDKYGVKLLSIDNKPYFDSVTLDSQLDLAQAAKMANISIEELYYLNPELNRWATPPSNNFKLKLPITSIDLFKENLANLPASKRVTWHRHTIKSGDNLGTLAKKYRTDVKTIKSVNNLTNSQIVVGKTLMIPTAQSGSANYSLSQSLRHQKKQSRSPRSGLMKNIHIVGKGDTFWSIAKKHKVKVGSLAKWNNKSPKDTLSIGEKLVIWKKSNSGMRQAKIRKISYRVRQGDSLAKIASKFNVKVADIVSWNGIKKNAYLQPKQQLKLYVNVMETYR